MKPLSMFRAYPWAATEHGTSSPRNPDKFAAAIPVCGGIDESYMEGLKGMPIRTFRAADDTIVKQ